MAAWQERRDGLGLSVRLTPRGGRDACDGIETLADGREVLKIRVRAAPMEGEANAALIAFLSRWLDLPRSRVSLVSGHSARIKTLALDGDPAALTTRIEAALAAAR